jgi:hypothetical protein
MSGSGHTSTENLFLIIILNGYFAIARMESRKNCHLRRFSIYFNLRPEGEKGKNDAAGSKPARAHN